MSSQVIQLQVPAEPSFACSVRVTAASLAVVAKMGVDEVEDVRMAAEEGFVLACGSQTDTVDISFTLRDDGLEMAFKTDGAPDTTHENYELAHALLSALCETYEIDNNTIRLKIVKL